MADKIKLLKNCKICKSSDLSEVFSLNEQYLSPTFVKSNTNNPLANFKSRLTLVLCNKKKKQRKLWSFAIKRNHGSRFTL